MDSSTTGGRLPAWGLGVVLLAALGCEPGPEYAVERLAFDRTGWDTLTVDVQFARRQFLRRPRPEEPRALSVVLFDAAYDTLFAGDGRVVPVPDHALGDSERLMIEICGRFEGVEVCEQGAVAASPKRLRLEHDIRFPEDAGYERGSYALRFVVERQTYAGEGWERIARPGRVEGYLLAYVGDRAEEAVRVPFSRATGRFSLRGMPHYDDFSFHLRSTLMDEREAQVRFDVYAGLNGQAPVHLASVEKQVREKTQDERALEVRAFAEQAAAAILERLVVSPRDRWARVYVDEWTFNPVTASYLVEVEIVWGRRRFFGARVYELGGRLEVGEDGTTPRFMQRGGNDRAARRWESEVGGRALALDALEPYVHDDADEGETAGAPSEEGLPEPETETRADRDGW